MTVTVKTRLVALMAVAVLLFLVLAFWWSCARPVVDPRPGDYPLLTITPVCLTWMRHAA